MKRMHIHVNVENLAESLKFYTVLFGAEPVKTKDDYAKWMLEDPRINFAISSRGNKAGVDHLGLQVESDEELTELRQRLTAADMSLFDEGKTVCCYAKSEKSWVQDPSGVAWEAYHTMADAQMFSDTTHKTETEACCVPKSTEVASTKASGACC